MKIVDGRIELNSIELARAAGRYAMDLGYECTGRVSLAVDGERADEEFIFARVELGPHDPPPEPVIEAINRG